MDFFHFSNPQGIIDMDVKEFGLKIHSVKVRFDDFFETRIKDQVPDADKDYERDAYDEILNSFIFDADEQNPNEEIKLVETDAFGFLTFELLGLLDLDAVFERAAYLLKLSTEMALDQIIDRTSDVEE